MQLGITEQKIEALPNDDVQRVVWWYGPILRNDSSAEDIPIVMVLFKKIENGVISDKSEMYQLGLPYLDIARIGSIWAGKQKVVGNWTEYGEEAISKEKFSFDLTKHEAQSISFLTKEQGHWIVPPFKYSLGKLSQKGQIYFFNSTMLKLHSNNNKTVLIPSLEFMTSTWLPENHQLRDEIFTSNVDVFLHKNVKSCMVKSDRYIIRLYNKKVRSTVKFLAYLTCNPITKQNISKLWSSLEKCNVDSNGKPYPNRQPIVLPYHPKKLNFTAEGIWLKKETFLVLRIYKAPPPKGRDIKAIIPKIDSGDETSNVAINQNVITDTEAEITHQHNPTRASGVVYIKTEIEIESCNDIIYEEEERTQPSASSYVENINEIKAISSGEMKNNLDSENIASTKIDTKNKQNDDSPEYRPMNNIEQHKVLREVEDALENLKDDEDLNIENIYYLNNDAHLTLMPSYCYFPIDHPDLEKSKSWLTKNSMNRKALLVKIVLQNKKSAYLLEINRHSNNESFLGIAFQLLGGKIDKKNIASLLVKIAKIKGKYSSNKNHKRSYVDLPVERKKFYDHNKIQKSMQKKIKHVIQNIAKDIFI